MSYVDWIDHHGSTERGFKSVAEIVADSGEDFIIRTHGVVIYENEDKLIIASEERLDADLHQPFYRYTTTIMKKLVVGRGE